MRKLINIREKLAAVILLITLAGCFTTACAVPSVSAAGNDRETTPAVDQAAAATGSTAYREEIDTLTKALTEAQEELEKAQEALAQAEQERDEAADELAALQERCSRQYIAVFEIRRSQILPPFEERIIITTPITAEEYNTYQPGTELIQALPYINGPSDCLGVDWSITVTNTYITCEEPAE